MNCMIKDAILNLAIEASNDATIDYAVSLADMFGAHLVGVAFAYEPAPPAILVDDVPPAWIDEVRRHADAGAAAARFEEAAKLAGISAQALRTNATLRIRSAAWRAGSISRSCGRPIRTRARRRR